MYPTKNWMSFTAGKDGILTKILFFGKANYLISEHYGSGMKGFVRENNPAKGPKLGEWSLSRDEIVNQLAAQGLPETQDGWITIRMRGEIPQESGKTYFLICQEISDGRPWFGAFAFSEGNTYPAGRHWLHPEHDLVFRTYVGKPTDPRPKPTKLPCSTFFARWFSDTFHRKIPCYAASSSSTNAWEWASHSTNGRLQTSCRSK